MAKFTCIFRGGGYATPGMLSPTELQAHLAKWNAWADGLAKAGMKPTGTPFEHGGKTVRGRDKLVTDGPFAESKDLVSGTLTVEATSLEHATEMAHGCPILEFDGSVEVRPLLPDNQSTR